MDEQLAESSEFPWHLMNVIESEYPHIHPFMEVKKSKNVAIWSILFYQQRAMLISVTKKSTSIQIFDPDLVDEPGKISTSYRTRSDGSIWLPLDQSFNQEMFISLVGEIIAEKRRSVSVDRFGCCHNFIKCSDAKKCLYQDEYFSLGCYYLENLEAGRIFYGVNRNV